MNEMRMEQRSRDLPLVAQWFLDHLPVWVSEAVDPASLRRLRRWDRWADRQKVRRWVAGMIVLVFAINIGVAYLEYVRHGYGDGLGHRIVAFTTSASMCFSLSLMLFWSRVVYRFAGSSVEDSAMLEYGVSWDRLMVEQRRDLAMRNRAKLFARFFHADERQSVQEERAQRVAYRLLRRVAVASVTAAWVAYLIAPERASGWLRQWSGLLMDSPQMITWVVMVVVALPVLIRLWTEPDVMGEPKALELNRREV